MTLYFMNLRRQLPIFSALVISSLLVLFILHSADPRETFGRYFSEPISPGSSCESDRHNGKNDMIELPSEYTSKPEEPSFCAKRFGIAYLEDLRDLATEYCTPDSPSALTCFHSQTAADDRVDSFCIGRPAGFDSHERKFRLGCQLSANISESNPQTPINIPQYNELRSYWYETGPGVIFNTTVKLEGSNNSEYISPGLSPNYTIIIKREGAGNPWHSLMEIFSMTLTIDVLRLSRPKNAKSPFFSASDAENTQVVILDDAEDGPYFDLWSLFAKRPIKRIADLSDEAMGSENIIIPLAGASNPIWQGDWDAHACRNSDLLRTFSRRVLDFYHTKPREIQTDENIVITYVNRTNSRKLVNQEHLLDLVSTRFPHVTVQSVDFGSLPFYEQLRTAQNTDILLGVHGAGLTHGLFLPEDSVMVEILPPGLNHKGFRNFAGILGHSYYSTHASGFAVDIDKRDEWHNKDVLVEEDRFLELMDVAVKDLYNRGMRNFDVN